MRPVLLLTAISATTVCSLADEPAAPPAPLLPSPGYAFPDGEESQITVEIRTATASLNQLRDLQPEADRVTTPLSTPLELSDLQEDQLPASGIQLIAAQAMKEYQQTTWVCLLKDPQVAALLTTLRQDARSNILMAPKITLFNRQTATVADVVQRPVANLGIQSTEPAAEQVEVQTAEQGFKFLLRCRTLPDRGVRVDCRAVVSDFTADPAPFAAAASRQPRFAVSKCDVEVSANIPEGQTLAVWGMKRPDDRHQRAVPGRSRMHQLLSSKQIEVVSDQTLVLLIKPVIVSGK